MIREEFVWTTVVLLALALLLRPRKPQIRGIYCLTVTIATVLVWGTEPGLVTCTLFPIFIVPLLTALYSRYLWRKAFLIYVLFRITCLMTLELKDENICGVWEYLLLNLRDGILMMSIGVWIVWLFRGGFQQMERWETQRKTGTGGMP